MKKILFPIIVMILPLISMSQNEKKWDIQLSGGPVVSYGDIQKHSLVYPSLDNGNAWKFGGALNLGYNLSRSLGLRGQLKYMEIGGAEPGLGNYFQGTVQDASLMLKLNFSEIFGNHNPYRTANIYSLLGVGLSNWDTELNISGPINHNPLEIEQRTTEGFVPAGLGVSLRLSDNFDLNLEGLVNVANSDKLDRTEKGLALDSYSYTSLGVSYKFGKSTVKRRAPARETQPEPEPDTIAEVKEEPIEKEPEPVKVTVSSDMPSEVEAGQSFGVAIRINKATLNGPATLRQVFPENAKLQPLSLAGGEYNFMNQVFTVNWQSMPEQPTLKVMYRVQTEDMKGGTYPISGIFTYTQNNNSKLINLENSLKVAAPEKEVKEEKKEMDKMKQGVVFRVQIRAKYQKKMSRDALAAKYNINEDIYEDYHQGYYIYTVGNFSTYQQARIKRDQLINQHGVPDAFVTAFKNGKRVDKLKELDQF